MHNNQSVTCWPSTYPCSSGLFRSGLGCSGGPRGWGSNGSSRGRAPRCSHSQQALTTGHESMRAYMHMYKLIIMATCACFFPPAPLGGTLSSPGAGGGGRGGTRARGGADEQIPVQGPEVQTAHPSAQSGGPLASGRTYRPPHPTQKHRRNRPSEWAGHSVSITEARTVKGNILLYVQLYVVGHVLAACARAS